MKKRIIWIAAMVIVLAAAFGITGVAAGWFSSSLVPVWNGDGSFSLEETPAVVENIELNDDVIELPEVYWD